MFMLLGVQIDCCLLIWKNPIVCFVPRSENKSIIPTGRKSSKLNGAFSGNLTQKQGNSFLSSSKLTLTMIEIDYLIVHIPPTTLKNNERYNIKMWDIFYAPYWLNQSFKLSDYDTIYLHTGLAQDKVSYNVSL